MVSLWYPTQRAHGYPLAPWLPPAAWARFEQDALGVQGVLQAPLTHGRVGAPVERRRGGRPVVLYSPGLGGIRDSNTVLVEELVSRGFIVVTIDHTHEAGQVEFPGGRVETPALPPLTPEVLERAVAVRVADTRFVLDTLVALNAGSNPDAEHRRLPAGLRSALRLSSVGMFGHSLGGATAAETMLEDRRISAGVNLDGTLFGPVVNAGLDRPFMLVAAQGHGRDNDETWAKFWANLLRWRLNLRLIGSAHNSFTDFQVLVPQVAGVLNLTPDAVQQLIGIIDPHRSIINQRAYITAFFNLHLRHRDNHLLDHPIPRFPEMQFVP
jgi:dienelactone hydrolase